MVGKEKQTILTGNDVLAFNRFYNGKEEPPIFKKQFIDLKDKIFLPLSYIKIKNLIKYHNNKADSILHINEQR